MLNFPSGVNWPQMIGHWLFWAVISKLVSLKLKQKCRCLRRIIYRVYSWWTQHYGCLFNPGDFGRFEWIWSVDQQYFLRWATLCLCLCLCLLSKLVPSQRTGARSVYFYCTAIEFMHSCAFRWAVRVITATGSCSIEGLLYVWTIDFQWDLCPLCLRVRARGWRACLA